MGKIKAGVVVVTEFCRPNDNRFQGYIDYINRSKAVRNKNTAKYNLYQDYMGNPNKTSGLFTSEKDNLSEDEKMQLKEIFEQAQSNESVMWQTVISFDNRWLKQNGIISENDDAIDETKLKEVARGGVNRMLEAEKLDNAVWSGAIHFNTDNIHIHIATVEPVPMREKKEYTQYEYAYQNGKRIRKPILDENGKPLTKMEYKGRLKPKSIEKCKSYVVNELVNDKENNIKINQIIRDSIVKQKSEHPLVQDEELVKLFEELYQKMPDCNRNLWNYNNPIMARLRTDIDNISTHYLEKYHSDEFKELRERINTQEEVYKQAYGDSKKDYGKNKMKDLYTRLGNAILKEIKKYDNELKNAEEKLGDNFVPLDTEDEKEQINKVYSTEIYEAENEMNDVDVDDFIEPEADVEDSYYEWSKKYKKARRLIHQKNPDYETATMLLLEEHNAGNILATYELGEVYKKGIGTKINTKTAEHYYQRAFRGFEVQLKNCSSEDKKSSYVNYRLGKMHYYGQGTEKNYELAKQRFELSENDYSRYMLGKMKYYGQGMDKDFQGAFSDFESVSENNGYAAYKAASMIENDEVNLGDNFVPLEKKEELYDSAFIQFSEMERKNPDDNLEYRIGMMYLNGQGTEQNNEKGKEYLEKSAEAKNVYAMNKLAKIYLEEKNIEMLPKALEYLKEAATVGKSDMAMYALGNVYSDNEYGMKDKLEAEKWYRMAEKEGNGYAAYKLGKLKIDDGNIREAVEHLSMADNKYAWYKLGKIYLNENEEMFNPEKGIMYMEKSAEEGNSFAQYQIGKIYNNGKYIERDEEKSMYWFGRASEQNNEYAAYQLGKIYYDKKDYPNSEQQFLKCENESIKPYSDYYLGKMYLDKDGKLFNPEKGIEYMVRSAEAGNNTASFIIGITYLKGKVVKEDRTLGRQWIERAANEGNEYASEFLKNINQKSNNRGIGLRHARAMILSNATRALKKALKDEWQKRQNVREHEKLVEESIDI